MNSSKISLREGFDFLFEEDEAKKEKVTKFNIQYNDQKIDTSSTSNQIAFILALDIVSAAINKSSDTILTRNFTQDEKDSFFVGKTLDFTRLQTVTKNASSFSDVFGITQDNQNKQVQTLFSKYAECINGLTASGISGILLSEGDNQPVKISLQRYTKMILVLKNTAALPKDKRGNKINFNLLFEKIQEYISSGRLFKQGGGIDQAFEELSNHEKLLYGFQKYLKTLSRYQKQNIRMNVIKTFMSDLSDGDKDITSIYTNFVSNMGSRTSGKMKRAIEDLTKDLINADSAEELKTAVVDAVDVAQKEASDETPAKDQTLEVVMGNAPKEFTKVSVDDNDGLSEAVSMILTGELYAMLLDSNNNSLLINQRPNSQIDLGKISINLGDSLEKKEIKEKSGSNLRAFTNAVRKAAEALGGGQTKLSLLEETGFNYKLEVSLSAVNAILSGLERVEGNFNVGNVYNSIFSQAGNLNLSFGNYNQSADDSSAEKNISKEIEKFIDKTKKVGDAFKSFIDSRQEKLNKFDENTPPVNLKNFIDSNFKALTRLVPRIGITKNIIQNYAKDDLFNKQQSKSIGEEFTKLENCQTSIQDQLKQIYSIIEKIKDVKAAEKLVDQASNIELKPDTDEIKKSEDLEKELTVDIDQDEIVKDAKEELDKIGPFGRPPGPPATKTRPTRPTFDEDEDKDKKDDLVIETALRAPTNYDEFMKQVVVYSSVAIRTNNQFPLLFNQSEYTVEEIVNLFEKEIARLAAEMGGDSADMLNQSINNFKSYGDKQIDKLLVEEENQGKVSLQIKLEGKNSLKDCAIKLLTYLKTEISGDESLKPDLLVQSYKLMDTFNIYPDFKIVKDGKETNTSITQALEALDASDNVSYEKEGNTITVNDGDNPKIEINTVAGTASVVGALEQNDKTTVSVPALQDNPEAVGRALNLDDVDLSNFAEDVIPNINLKGVIDADESVEDLGLSEEQVKNIINADREKVDDSEKESSYRSELTLEQFANILNNSFDIFYSNKHEILDAFNTYNDKNNNRVFFKNDDEFKVLIERNQLSLTYSQNEIVQMLPTPYINVIRDFIKDSYRNEMQVIFDALYGPDSRFIEDAFISAYTKLITDATYRAIGEGNADDRVTEVIGEGIFDVLKASGKAISTGLRWLPKLFGGMTIMMIAKASIVALGGAALISPIIATLGAMGIWSSFKNKKEFENAKKQYAKNPLKYIEETIFNDSNARKAITLLVKNAIAKQICDLLEGKVKKSKLDMSKLSLKNVQTSNDNYIDYWSNLDGDKKQKLKELNNTFLEKFRSTTLYREGIINDSTINILFNELFLTQDNLASDKEAPNKDIEDKLLKAIDKTSFKANFIDWTENEARLVSGGKSKSSSRFQIEYRDEIKDKKQLFISPEQISKDYTNYLFSKAFGVFLENEQKSDIYNRKELESVQQEGLYFNPKFAIKGSLTNLLFEDSRIMLNEQSEEEGSSSGSANDLKNYTKTLMCLAADASQAAQIDAASGGALEDASFDLLSAVKSVLIPAASAEPAPAANISLPSNEEINNIKLTTNDVSDGLEKIFVEKVNSLTSNKEIIEFLSQDAKMAAINTSAKKGIVSGYKYLNDLDTSLKEYIKWLDDHDITSVKDNKDGMVWAIKKSSSDSSGTIPGYVWKQSSAGNLSPKDSMHWNTKNVGEKLIVSRNIIKNVIDHNKVLDSERAAISDKELIATLKQIKYYKSNEDIVDPDSLVKAAIKSFVGGESNIAGANPGDALQAKISSINIDNVDIKLKDEEVVKIFEKVFLEKLASINNSKNYDADIDIFFTIEDKNWPGQPFYSISKYSGVVDGKINGPLWINDIDNYLTKYTEWLDSHKLQINNDKFYIQKINADSEKNINGYIWKKFFAGKNVGDRIELTQKQIEQIMVHNKVRPYVKGEEGSFTSYGEIKNEEINTAFKKVSEISKLQDVSDADKLKLTNRVVDNYISGESNVDAPIAEPAASTAGNEATVKAAQEVESNVTVSDSFSEKDLKELNALNKKLGLPEFKPEDALKDYAKGVSKAIANTKPDDIDQVATKKLAAKFSELSNDDSVAKIKGAVPFFKSFSNALTSPSTPSAGTSGTLKVAGAKFGYVSSPAEAMQYQKMHFDPIIKQVLIKEGGRQKILQFFMSSQESLHGKAKALGCVKIDLSKGTSEFMGSGPKFQQNYVDNPQNANYLERLGVVFKGGDGTGKLPELADGGTAKELSPDDAIAKQGLKIVLTSLKGSVKQVFEASETAVKKLALKSALQSDAEFTANALGEESNFKSLAKFSYKQWSQKGVIGKQVGQDMKVEGPQDVLKLIFNNAQDRIDDIDGGSVAIRKFLTDPDINRVHKEIIEVNKKLAKIGMDSPDDIGAPPQDDSIIGNFLSKFTFDISMPGGEIDDGEVSAPDIMTSASKAEQAEVDALMAKKAALYQQWENAIEKAFDKYLGNLGKSVMKTIFQSFEGDAKSLGYNPVYKKLVDDIAQKTGKTPDEVVSEVQEGDATSLSDPDNNDTTATIQNDTDVATNQISDDQVSTLKAGAKEVLASSEDANIKDLSGNIVDDASVKAFKSSKNAEEFVETFNNELSKKLDLSGGDEEQITAVKEQIATAVAKVASQSGAGEEGSLMKSILNIDFTNPDTYTAIAGPIAGLGILSKIASKFYTRGIKGGTFAKQFYAAAQPEKVFASMAITIFSSGNEFDNYYGNNRQKAVNKAVTDFESGVNPSLIKFKFEPVQEDESLGLDTINQASQLQPAAQQTSEQLVYRTSISNFLFEDIVIKRSDINENANRNSYQKEINDHNSLTKEFNNFFK